ncbi:ArnT family glycosyltransferase [Zobellia uliginosa]|uniref:ArnT family glycosyltransferase n=1 Tax=Zobellia uliginosa TaxID=143224 RepID=UPI0026E14B35|nr:glycosyltransferase family 39 protein [Zobellia uliginosa]MDO6519707.1 glycosyltransferase family 39 protein [Zobellia uliginosa]
MISDLRYRFLLVLIVLVYVAGMFVTLFEPDSAQFAVMAMRMVQENDFLNLIKGGSQYLDKPHLHFWLSAFSFKLFGFYEWAYRLPAILVTLLGAYSCFGLGNLLYNRNTGRLAALIFMTAQTIVLSVIDVRTDAALTAFTILAIWQFTSYIEKGSLASVCIGAVAAGLAFSSKGQIALFVIGSALICHLAYTHKWQRVLSYKVLVGLGFFAIAIAPMLYAYYHQFDMHPEKVIRGTTGHSGIRFIFLEQSLERSGGAMGKTSSDYFFFFHTFLWVFIPWTIPAVVAVGSRIKAIFKLRFAYHPQYEFMTLGTIAIFFLVASFSQFKLPHYLNIVIPLFAVLTASYIIDLVKVDNKKILTIFLGSQYFVLSVVFTAVLFICFYVFEFQSLLAWGLLIVLCGIIVYFCLKREARFLRVITLSVYSSLLLNSVMNLHFYPNLLLYQAGSSMAEVVADENIPVDRIYRISDFNTWALDFYNRQRVKHTSLKNVQEKKDIWLYVNDKDLRRVQDAGLDWDQQFIENDYNISMLTMGFLNPSTRKRSLKKMHLIHLR